MEKSELLYVRNMTTSESDKDEENQDIWDDSKLNDAYDKALRIANAEVAKRLAMSTNTPSSKDGAKVKNPVPITATTSSKKKEKKKWKAGMHCRAVYEGDGVEYEAYLMRIINDKECVVRFLGYDNTEIVAVSSLKSSQGKRERTQQIEDALAENLVNGLSNHNDEMECSDVPQSSTSTASLKKKKEKKIKNNKQKPMSVFDLPEISTLPFPNLAQLRNMGAMDMPIPPPPTTSLARSEVESEEQAVSSMLFSWYMSGYYTGLYQGMKRAREARNK